MAEKKREIDWNKWLLLALAVAVLVGGQWYLMSQNRPPPGNPGTSASSGVGTAVSSKTASATPATPGTGPAAAPVAISAAPVEATKSPPQRIVSDASPLDLTFVCNGGALQSAVLTEYKLTARSEKRGVELLDEIRSGTRSLEIGSCRLNLRSSSGAEEDLKFENLHQRIWELVKEETSSGFVDPDRTWTVTYSASLDLSDAQGKTKELARLFKRFRVREDGRHLDMEVWLKNLGDRPLSYEYALRGAAGILMDGPPHDPEQSAYAAIRAVLTGRTERGPEPAAITVYAEGAAKATEESRRVSSIENVWGAALNRFFMAALISRQPSRPIKIVAEPLAPNRQDRPGDKRFLRPNISPVFWMKAGEEVAPGTESPRDAFSFYLGPAGENELANYEPRLGADAPTHLNLAVQYCDVGSWRWPNIDRLARLLLWLFNLIASVTSYGLAVILLTLVIKLALHPLQRKMTVSMYKMQQLQPKLKAIEDKYGNVTDPKIKQKKELEKLDLMRKEGAKPWSGCLPMFLQVPIFFALFGAFSHAFEIRQAGFLWIADLSLADRLVTFSFWPQEINLLPLLYAALSLYQGLTQPKPANEDPQQALQRKMFLVMPVVISFIFYRMPSGLVLYFTASSIFGLLENWFIKRYVLKIGSDGKPLVPATAATATPAKKGR